MPPPWKKLKNTSLSRLVNDHLHRSQKRRDGSSLFVETGFPTSLVDLFLKNRDKLKRMSKKKIPQAPQNPIADYRDPAIPTELPSISPPPVIAGSIVSDSGVDPITVLMLVLKMFLVLILTLGTKRLTVGITISALLLILLEYVAKGFLKSTLLDVLRLLRFKEQEIRAAECEVQPVDKIIKAASCNETEPEVVVVAKEDESNALKRKSRKAMLKSKMKKLVPKRFRCSSRRVGIIGEEVVEDSCVFLGVQCNEGSESGNGGESSSSSSSVCELSETDTREEEREEKIENWKCLFLFGVVLAGLVGGMVFAVIVTSSWFLMLKSGGKLSKCVMKVSMIKSGD